MLAVDLPKMWRTHAADRLHNGASGGRENTLAYRRAD